MTACPETFRGAQAIQPATGRAEEWGMTGIINWLNSVLKPDDLVKLLLTMLPGTGLFIILFQIFQLGKSWIDFAVKTGETSVRAYQNVVVLAGRFTFVKALLTIIAAAGLVFWVFGVQAMTNLALYVMVRMQENDWSWNIASLNLASILHGVNWYGYGVVTQYVIPAAITALVLLAVSYRGIGGLLARAIFFVFGALGNAPMLFVGILTIFPLLGDFFSHGIYLFNQRDNLGWDVVITLGFGLYLASFFMVNALIGKVRQLWALPV
jgi:hypothetical protein